MKSTTTVIVLLFVLTPAYCQQKLRDSLQNELAKREAIDAHYIDLLNDLSFEYIKSRPESSLLVINRALILADSLGYQSGLVRATTNKGNSFWVIGLHDQALSYYLLALSQSSDTLSLNYARLNNNIGEVFKKKKLYDSAMRYYFNAWEVMHEAMGLKHPLLAYNIAEGFLFLDKIDSSQQYYQLAKDYAEQSDDRRGLAYAYFGLAEIAHRKGLTGKALRLQNQSLKIRLDIEDNRGAIQNYLSISSYHLEKALHEESELSLALGRKLAMKSNAKDLLLEVENLAYRILIANKKYEEAVRVLQSYEQLKDSLRTEEFSSSVEKMKSALMAEIHSKENQLLLQEQESSEQINETRLITISLLSILLIITIRLFYQFREKRRLITHQGEKDVLIEKLQLRNQNLEEFNSVLSHNLREPLTQIIGFAKYYEHGSPGITTDEIISNIKKSSLKIDQSIRALSTVLNEKDPEKKDYTTFKLVEVMEEVVADLHEQLAAISNEIYMDFDSDFNLHSYKPFLYDIFYHLFSNAIKFRSQDRSLQISIRATKKRDSVEIDFVDNGLGMSADLVRNKIFKMHQKFHSELSGRGVGLYVVRNRIESLSGKINFDSNEGAGTAFSIELPFN